MFGEVWENVFGIQTLSKKTLKHDLKLTLEYVGSSEVCAKVWSGCNILRKGECIMVVFSKVIINPKKRSFRFSTWSFSIYQNHFFPQAFVSTSSTCPFFCWQPEDMGYFDWVDQFLAENPGYVELSDRMILVPLKSNTERSEVKEVGDSLRGWCSFFRIFPQHFRLNFLIFLNKNCLNPIFCLETTGCFHWEKLVLLVGNWARIGRNFYGWISWRNIDIHISPAKERNQPHEKYHGMGGDTCDWLRTYQLHGTNVMFRMFVHDCFVCIRLYAPFVFFPLLYDARLYNTAQI